jgi:hypothetical protein
VRVEPHPSSGSAADVSSNPISRSTPARPLYQPHVWSISATISEFGNSLIPENWQSLVKMFLGAPLRVEAATAYAFPSRRMTSKSPSTILSL